MADTTILLGSIPRSHLKWVIKDETLEKLLEYNVPSPFGLHSPWSQSFPLNASTNIFSIKNLFGDRWQEHFRNPLLA